MRTYGFTDLRRYGPWDLGVARFTIYGCAALWTYGLLDQVIFDLDWPPGGRTVSGSLDVLLFAAPWTYGFSDARWTYRPVDDRLAASYWRPIRCDVGLWACSLAALRLYIAFTDDRTRTLTDQWAICCAPPMELISSRVGGLADLRIYRPTALRTMGPTGCQIYDVDVRFVFWARGLWTWIGHRCLGRWT